MFKTLICLETDLCTLIVKENIDFGLSPVCSGSMNKLLGHSAKEQLSMKIRFVTTSCQCCIYHNVWPSDALAASEQSIYASAQDVYSSVSAPRRLKTVSYLVQLR